MSDEDDITGEAVDETQEEIDEIGEETGGGETQSINIMTSAEENNDTAGGQGKTKCFLVKTSTGSFLVPMSAEGSALGDPDTSLPPHVAAVLNQANANRLVNQTVTSDSNQTVSSESNQTVLSESNQTILSGYQNVSEVNLTNQEGIVTAKRIDLVPRSGSVTRRRAPYITQTISRDEQFAAEIAAYNKEMYQKRESRSRSGSESSTGSRNRSESSTGSRNRSKSSTRSRNRSESSTGSRNRSLSSSEHKQSAGHVDSCNSGQVPESDSTVSPPRDSVTTRLKRASVGSPEPSPPAAKQAKTSPPAKHAKPSSPEAKHAQSEESPVARTLPILETLQREIPLPEREIERPAKPGKPKSSMDRIKELKERLRKQQEKLEEVRKKNITKVNLEEFDDI